MQQVIVAEDENGRSFFKSVRTFDEFSFMESSPGGDLLTGTARIETAPVVPADGQALVTPMFTLDGPALEEGLAAVPPGVAMLRWSRCTLGPNTTMQMHRTQSVDVDLVLDGEMELSADDGTITLIPGDQVVIMRAFHSWRTFDRPCTFALTGLSRGPRRGFEFRT